jgi:hypothetical protein
MAALSSWCSAGPSSLPNQEGLADQVKSWAWVMKELRQNGGRVQADSLDITAPDTLDVAAVCIPPITGKSTDAFDEARAAFRDLDVEWLAPDAVHVLGERAATALAA